MHRLQDSLREGEVENALLKEELALYKSQVTLLTNQLRSVLHQDASISKQSSSNRLLRLSYRGLLCSA